MRPHNTIAKFWGLVDKTDGCWLWRGTTIPQGYGLFSYRGQQFYSHRFVASVCMGWNIDGLQVCHTCDNPSCVNPDHLFLGTHQDNLKDRDKKGRQTRGEKSHLSVLTEEDVVRIRSDEFSGKSTSEIASEFGVNRVTVWCVLRGKTWKHLL